MRRHKGDVTAATARFKKPAAGSRRGLNGCDAEDVPVICPTCQMPLHAKNPLVSSLPGVVEFEDGIERGRDQWRRREPAACIGVGLCRQDRAWSGKPANFLDYFPKLRMLGQVDSADLEHQRIR
jgi:hypothetical protein